MAAAPYYPSRGFIVFLCFILLCVTAGLYAMFIEPRMLTVREWHVVNPRWNEKPLRIAILTDFHINHPWMTPEHVTEIVTRTNALKADLIVLLGDYYGKSLFSTDIAPESGIAPLTRLTAPCGVYAVLGNHDFRPPKGWPEALRNSGIPVLENRATKVVCDNKQFWVAGLEDLWWQKTDIHKTLSDVQDASPVLLLMHNPDSFPEIPDRVALTLAGHTHGGQLKLPFIGAIKEVVPSRYGLRYVHGHIIEENRHMVVSSGLGMTALPMRFMNPPEIGLVILSSEPDAVVK